MSRGKGTITITRHGYTLVVTLSGGKRFFDCPRLPEIAQRWDGTEDPTDALDFFEAKAVPPARQPTLFEGEGQS